MPGSKDFQNLQIGPRQTLLLAGMLIYDVSEHPPSKIRQAQKQGLERFKCFGNHIYRDVGMEGVMNMSDDELKEMLSQCAHMLSQLKNQYGAEATSRQKMSMDAARGACLLRIEWIDAGISHMRKDEYTGKESIITMDNREIPQDPVAHSYLTLVSPSTEFRVEARQTPALEDKSSKKAPKGDKKRRSRFNILGIRFKL